MALGIWKSAESCTGAPPGRRPAGEDRRRESSGPPPLLGRRADVDAGEMIARAVRPKRLGPTVLWRVIHHHVGPATTSTVICYPEHALGVAPVPGSIPWKRRHLRKDFIARLVEGRDVELLFRRLSSQRRR
jgi:hypothetical protein